MLFTLGAIGLFLLTSWLDRTVAPRIASSGHSNWASPTLFAGGPNGAQALLTNISGMWATIIGISFSVTLVTIQLTATKYIAQVLPLFERDKTNQIVLGTYLATVTYAMLVARTVRAEEPAFVPYIGVNVATALAVGSIFLLILFITNVVNFVRPQFFLAQTLTDTQTALAHLADDHTAWRPHPSRLTAPPEAPAEAVCVTSRRKGTLTAIAWRELGEALPRLLETGRAPGGTWQIYFMRSPGEPVQRGEPLAKARPPAACTELEAGGGKVTVFRPSPDLLAKLIRELTVVSEVALAPSLPFRLVTEGISRRFSEALLQLAKEGEWEAFMRVAREIDGWYQSAFFHMAWVNGMQHLAGDLVELANDAQAREALDGAFGHLAAELGPDGV